MEEAEFITWLIAEGSPVTKDLPIFELETDKALVEVPSPADGLLLRIVTPSGLVRVDEVVGWVGLEGETIDTSHRLPIREIATPPTTTAVQTSDHVAAEGRTPVDLLGILRIRSLQVVLFAWNWLTCVTADTRLTIRKKSSIRAASQCLCTMHSDGSPRV